MSEAETASAGVKSTKIKRSVTMRLFGGQSEAMKCLINSPHRMGSVIGTVRSHDIKMSVLPSGEPSESVRFNGTFEAIKSDGTSYTDLTECYLPAKVALWVREQFENNGGGPLDLMIDIDAIKSERAGGMPFEYDVTAHRAAGAPDPLDRLRAMRANLLAGRPLLEGVQGKLAAPSPVPPVSTEQADPSASAETASSSTQHPQGKSGAKKAA